MSRCSAARGSSTGFSHDGPAKVGTHKSFLFTESSLELKIKNTRLITGNPPAEWTSYFFNEKFSNIQYFTVLDGLKCEQLANNGKMQGLNNNNY